MYACVCVSFEQEVREKRMGRIKEQVTRRGFYSHPLSLPSLPLVGHIEKRARAHERTYTLLSRNIDTYPHTNAGIFMST